MIEEKYRRRYKYFVLLSKYKLKCSKIPDNRNILNNKIRKIIMEVDSFLIIFWSKKIFIIARKSRILMYSFFSNRMLRKNLLQVSRYYFFKKITSILCQIWKYIYMILIVKNTKFTFTNSRCRCNSLIFFNRFLLYICENIHCNKTKCSAESRFPFRDSSWDDEIKARRETKC